MKGKENMSACAVQEEKSKRETRNDEATLRRGGWDGWAAPARALGGPVAQAKACGQAGLDGRRGQTEACVVLVGEPTRQGWAGSGFRLASWRQQGKLPALND